MPLAPPALTPSAIPCLALARALGSMRPIGLDALDGVALQERTDTKYVLALPQVAAALEAVAGAYRVLEIDGRRIHRYRSVYFDTPDLALYLAHHRAKPGRVKVRSRLYEDSGLSFLEVKRKSSAGRTTKVRTQTVAPVEQMDGDALAFVGDHLGDAISTLQPRLVSTFARATLASEAHPERLTIDLGLGFQGNGESFAAPGVGIVEVKEASGHHDSAFIAHMRRLGIHPTAFSKYCIGVACLFPIKHNRFNPELRLLRQLQEVAVHV